MAMSKASSPVTTCQARRLRRRRPCASISSARPTSTSVVRATFISVPGTRWLRVWNRYTRSGRRVLTMSDRPMSAVSRAAARGTQAR